MDEKSAVERVDAAYEKLTAANARIKSLEKKLADGTLTMKEGAELTDLRAQAFGTAFSGGVLDIAQDERESACTELLRKRCDDTDEVAEAAQRAALSRQGLNLTPPTAPFEEDRARKIGHSLEDDTVPDETIQRRAKSATETMIRSQYDRNMKQGAKTCAEAGLKTYIIRDSASGCCKWCDEVAGKFAYGSEPKDVYRRHDNCSCSVVYESGRGRQNVWSKQTWSKEQEQEYLRLRDEMAPKRLNARQAQALREQVGGLTFGGNGGILNLTRSVQIPDDFKFINSAKNNFANFSNKELSLEILESIEKTIAERTAEKNDFKFDNIYVGKFDKAHEKSVFITDVAEIGYSQTTTLYLNSRFFIGVSKSDIDTMCKSLKSKGWWQSECLEDLVNHEIIHARLGYHSGVYKTQQMEQLLSESENTKGFCRLVDKQPGEFMNEVFVALKRGETIDKQYLDIYNQYAADYLGGNLYG